MVKAQCFKLSTVGLSERQGRLARISSRLHHCANANMAFEMLRRYALPVTICFLTGAFTNRSRGRRRLDQVLTQKTAGMRQHLTPRLKWHKPSATEELDRCRVLSDFIRVPTRSAQDATPPRTLRSSSFVRRLDPRLEEVPMLVLVAVSRVSWEPIRDGHAVGYALQGMHPSAPLV